MEYALVISGTIGCWWNGCSADYVRYTLNKNKDKDVHVGFCSLGGFVKDGLEMYQAFKDHGNVHAHAFDGIYNQYEDGGWDCDERVDEELVAHPAPLCPGRCNGGVRNE